MAVTKESNDLLNKNRLFWNIGLTIFFSGLIFLFVNEIVLLFIESTFTSTFDPQFFSYFLIETTSWSSYELGKTFIIFITIADLLIVAAFILCIISFFVKKNKISLRRIANLFGILYLTITTLALIFLSPGFYLEKKLSEINIPSFYIYQGLNFYALILLLVGCLVVITFLILKFVTKRFSLKLINGSFLVFFAIIARVNGVLLYRYYTQQIDLQLYPHQINSFTFLSSGIEFIIYLILGIALLAIGLVEELTRRKIVLLKTNSLSTIFGGFVLVILTAIYSIVHFSTGIHFLSTGNILYSLAKIILLIGFVTTTLSAILYLNKQLLNSKKTSAVQVDYFDSNDEAFDSLAEQKNNKTKKKLPVDIEEELKKEELFKKGLLLADKGRFRRAIAVWKALVELEPSNYIVINNIGLAYKELGRLRTAIKYWEQALNIKPNYGQAKNNLDIALEIIKQKEKKKLISKKDDKTNQE